MNEGYNTMKKLTVKEVNKAIKQYGYEIVKGKSYFYFSTLDFKIYPHLYNSIIGGLYRLNDITLDGIIRELQSKINDYHNS